MEYDDIHIKKAIVYQQLLEFKCNFESSMIRNLKIKHDNLGFKVILKYNISINTGGRCMLFFIHR